MAVNRRPLQSDEPGGMAVVGGDRRVDELAGRLAGSGSAMIVGAYGSGKSYFSRAIVAELAHRGVFAAVVRGAAPLQTIPFGALRAAGDPRLETLWEGGGATETPLVIAIDDAHALDSASIDVVSRAIYAGRARVLFSVSSDGTSGLSAAPDPFRELWLDGIVARYDLQALDPETADVLISEFGGGDFDSVTRAALFVRSGGSRMLLHELCADAAAEFAAHRDPLDLARHAPVGSRLSDAYATALTDLSKEQHLAIAVVGRLPGIEFAAACRCVDPDDLDSLIAGKSLRTEGGRRELHVVPALAREAERMLDAGTLERALDLLARRALENPERPAGLAVDRLIAGFWHSMRDSVPGPAEVPADARRRILAGAARSANGDGRYDLALAFARHGAEVGQCAALRLETSRAYAGLRRFDEAFSVLAIDDPEQLNGHDLRRLVRWWASLTTWVPESHSIDRLAEALDAAGIDDAGVWSELDAQRAEFAALAMDWESACALADTVIRSRQTHSITRLRCTIIAAYSDMLLQRFESGEARFLAAARRNLDLVSGRPISVIGELVMLCLEAVAGSFTGRHNPTLADRLQIAVQLAAARNDSDTLALGNAATAMVLGFARGDDSVAERELAAALRRLDKIEYSVWRPLLSYMRAYALTRLGDTQKASLVLDLIDDRVLGHHKLYRYTALSVEASLNAASGDVRQGVELLNETIEHLGPSNETIVAAYEQARLTTYTEALRAGADSIRGRDLTPGFPHRDRRTAPADRTAGSPAPTETIDAVDELSEREYEIALLVAEQLSNKEIARRLFLSVRTVESHVYTARGKVGARTRRELGRVVADAEVARER